MPQAAVFEDTFVKLRAILEPYAKRMVVQTDQPANYTLGSPTQKDRLGRPLFIAAVQINKNYVSFHLMPVYGCPELVEQLSPTLRKRMQGKSCFNFTSIDPPQLKELA